MLTNRHNLRNTNQSAAASVAWLPCVVKCGATMFGNGLHSLPTDLLGGESMQGQGQPIGSRNLSDRRYSQS